MMTPDPDKAPDIFLSYSRKNNAEADEIDHFFSSQPINLLRDIRELQYNDNLNDFMKRVRTCDFVIAMISEPYLKSEFCMYEILQLIGDVNYKERILPLVIDGNGFGSPIGQADIVRFWEEKCDLLKQDLKELSPENAVKIAERLKRYRLIALSVGDFMEDLSTQIYRSYSELKKSSFKELLEEILNRTGPSENVAPEESGRDRSGFAKTTRNLPGIRTYIEKNNGKIVNIDTLHGTLNL